MRLEGVALVVYGPLTLAGAVLYFQLVGPAVASASSGEAALARIAQVGPVFRVMDALLHLSPILLIPGMAAIYRIGAPTQPGLALIALLVGMVGIVVPLGWIYALNEGLYRLAQGQAQLQDNGERASRAAAATMNLGVQAGGELLQSALLGTWALLAGVSLRIVWGDGWLLYLGVVAGIGFVASGFAAIVPRSGDLTRVLGAAGTAGVFLFLAWVVAVGVRLLI